MRIKLVLAFWFLCIACANCEGDAKSKSKRIKNKIAESYIYGSYRERLDTQIEMLEKDLKTFMKKTVKNMLAGVMNFNNGNITLSPTCMGGFFKFISGLTSGKLWAFQMLDATSKLPAGLLEGTFSDFGAFDECLNIELPKRNGELEFRGKYCAIEGSPFMPPVPKNFSVAKQAHANPTDSIGDEMKIAVMVFFYLKVRAGLCVPSVCSEEDIRALVKVVAEKYEVEIDVPKCYIKENIVFQPIHIAVIIIVSLLLIICIAGSVMEYKALKIPSTNLSTRQQVLMCFSFISNYKRLISASKGSEELKSIHGIKALSMGWIILGHTCAWIKTHLVRRPYNIPLIFLGFDYGAITNAWLVVETFFLLSGLLTSYVVLRLLPKTKGRINVPIFILRRYIRLTPPLLLAMGITFFLPMFGSGPFWYEMIDPEMEACKKYWWTNILYMSNWTGKNNICIHTTWFLSSDYQLYIISIVFLFLIYRIPKITVSLILAFILACTIAVGAITYVFDLPPFILSSSANTEVITKTLDKIHMNTFTHAGSYYVGFLVGYLITKHKNIKLSRNVNVCGWIVASFMFLSSLYGGYRWTIGEAHGLVLSIMYAALHRTTFSMGVAWVVFVCITGNGGLVNKFLSSSMLAPFGRLTYMVYLSHGFVIWIRYSTLREKTFFSYYNTIYEYVGNAAFAVSVTLPFYLMLECPLTNLDRLVFSRVRILQDNQPETQPKNHLRSNLTTGWSMQASKVKMDTAVPLNTTIVPVELMSVKTLENGNNNLAFNDELHCPKND